PLTPKPADSDLTVSAAGDVSVGGNVVGRDMVTVNNTVTLTLSGDLLAQLEQIKALSTELAKTSTGAAPAPQKAAEALKATEAIKSVDTALELLKSSQPAGASAQELQAGGLQISHVELLLKKAILLEVEADGILFDAFLQAGNRTDEAGERVLPDGYDDAPRLAKLRAAETHLREAQALDPANTEVLARLALLLSEVVPDNPAEPLKLLNQVQQLLSVPRDDVEKFRLAQAKYFLAINQEPPDLASLQEARVLFTNLGRLEWAAYVDNDLAAAEGGADFDPRGQWVIQVDDRAGTIIGLELLDDGQCRGWREAGTKAKKDASVSFSGVWGYDPEQQVLSFESQLETGRPFNLTIQLQGQDEQGLHAQDEKGRAYLLNRP
ncbi:MAG: hypothetical protein JNK29_01430, partial [Anaerolineales bacterium]|nr:hypothetical protein [Anaerolineales bacterium]